MFRFPPTRGHFTKRAVALPGDTIETEGRTVRIAPEPHAHRRREICGRGAR